MPEQVLEEVSREFKRLKSMKNSSNVEANIIRNFIDTVLELPWNASTQECNDLKKAGD